MEFEFKIGDTVKCKPGFHTVWKTDIQTDSTYGGAGYQEGKVFKIVRIFNGDGWPPYYTPSPSSDDSNGIYEWALEKIASGFYHTLSEFF